MELACISGWGATGAMVPTAPAVLVLPAVTAAVEVVLAAVVLEAATLDAAALDVLLLVAVIAEGSVTWVVT